MVDGGDDDGAATAPGAQWIELVEDVQLTAEVAVVDGQTAAETHPSEVRRLHHDHLVSRTAGNELFRLAELRYDTCPPISMYTTSSACIYDHFTLLTVTVKPCVHCSILVAAIRIE